MASMRKPLSQASFPENRLRRAPTTKERGAGDRRGYNHAVAGAAEERNEWQARATKAIKDDTAAPIGEPGVVPGSAQMN